MSQMFAWITGHASVFRWVIGSVRDPLPALMKYMHSSPTLHLDSSSLPHHCKLSTKCGANMIAIKSEGYDYGTRLQNLGNAYTP